MPAILAHFRPLQLMGTDPRSSAGIRRLRWPRGVSSCPGAAGWWRIWAGLPRMAEISLRGGAYHFPALRRFPLEVGLGAKIALRQAFETLPWRPDLGQDRVFTWWGHLACCGALMVKVDILCALCIAALDGQALRASQALYVARRSLDDGAVSATRRKLPWAALAAKLVRHGGQAGCVFGRACVRALVQFIGTH